jgi:hypothetical protein
VKTRCCSTSAYRPETAELAKLYTIVAPNYAAVAESYQRAQDVAKQPKP